jgi:mono/diheme cytochrome c family protein
MTLFMLTASVGLVYFVFGTISGTDSTEARPLAALGFWSLILVWAFMSGTELIHSAAPNWLESIAVAFAIGAFVPALAIAADVGLMIKGSVGNITDRSSLRYATVAGISMAVVTVVNFLLTFPASSSIAQFTGWVTGLGSLVVLGAASFAIFAGHSVLNGGNRSGTTFHFSWSTLGLTLITVGTLAGGVAVGFSWAAGPTSQKFPNWGPGWEVTANTVEPFIWTAALGLVVFAVAQIVFLIRVGAKNSAELETPQGAGSYDLEFSGEPKYLTWKRLVRGVTAVWLAAVAFTLVLPIVDDNATEASLLADTNRTYESGTRELAGRNLYISEGCVECHTQEVRAVAADVGLGPVSIAGDYANEEPVLRGAVRLGPDLFHAASREGFSSAGLKSLLENPRATRSWSIMPSYSYLSDSEIDALVSYIETLR